MKLQFIVISKTSFSFVERGITLFSDRISKYIPFEYKELILPKKRSSEKNSIIIKKYEAELILKNLVQGDFVVLLDEKGKQFNSRSFSKWIESKLTLSHKSIVFVVGGAFGFDKKLYDRADQLISLSSLTFSHQLIRLIFLEQLYRACTIMRNEKYHND